MKNFKLLFLSLFTLVLISSCNSDDDNDDGPFSECDFNVITDEDRFEAPSPGVYNVYNAEINNDCIQITIQSSGCDGNSWEVNLISTFGITNGFSSNAPLSLKLVNLELCEAYITKTYSFDVSELQGDNLETTFSLEGWDGVLQISN